MPLSLLRQDQQVMAAGEQVIDPEITRQVMSMLQAVVEEPGGGGARAQCRVTTLVVKVVQRNNWRSVAAIPRALTAHCLQALRPLIIHGLLR